MCNINSRRPYSNGRQTMLGNDVNNGPIKKRRVMKASVRFNNAVIIEVHEDDKCTSTGSSSSSSTWLSPNDFSDIQNGVFMTLNMMKLQEDRGDSFGYDTPLSSYYCSRGLEDYHTEQKGCLKLSTIQRRQNAIDAVLNEQESQRQQQQMQMQMKMRAGMACTYYMLDHAKIGEICKSQTYYNAENAIDMGRKDSEEALTIYSEPSTQLPLSPTEPFVNNITNTNTSTSTTTLFQESMLPQKQQWSFSRHCVTPMNNHPIFA